MAIKMLKLYECGHCVHPEKIVNPAGSLKPVSFPATVALLEHSVHGYLLFDTGYASHFFEAVRFFPYSLYAKLTPVYFQEEQSIKQQLAADGLSADQIGTIILSHFHGDHTAGLKDFPNARVMSFQAAYCDAQKRSRLSALTKGYLLNVLPDDLADRLSFVDHAAKVVLDDTFGGFQVGYSVFGDESLIAVDLAGHAVGQLGLFVSLRSGKRVFLCADAVWRSEAYEKLIFPHKLADLLIEDKKAYRENIRKLHELAKQQPAIDILPTHCHVTGEKARRGEQYE